MSRVAKSPIPLPKGVEIKLDGRDLTVKGGKGVLALTLNEGVQINQENAELTLSYDSEQFKAIAGTTRALLSNMVKGVSEGWERKLVLNGVGYRAKVSGDVVNLTIGLSHPVDYKVPKGITAESPSQTELLIKGVDKQAVGQVAAEIRSYRPPEPYKGKGIRYADEQVRRKETKKK